MSDAWIYSEDREFAPSCRRRWPSSGSAARVSANGSLLPSGDDGAGARRRSSSW